MAHIKVVRRSMRPEEWTDLRFGWLKRYIYSEKNEITSFRIKDARQVSEMNFEFYDEAWLDFVVESRSGLKPWSSYDIVEGGVANDRVIDTVELYTIGILDKASALGRLSEHQPNQ